MFPHKNYSLSNKNSSTKHEKTCFELLVRGLQESYQTILAIALILCFLPEFESDVSTLEDPTHFRLRTLRN